MVADLGISLSTALVMVALIAALTYLAVVRLKTRHEQTRNRPADPLMRVIVLLLLFVLVMSALYFFELTEWNPMEHPGMIALLGAGLYLLTWWQLRRLREKNFAELNEIARSFLHSQGVKFPKNLPYVETEIFKRVDKKGTLAGYFVFNATSTQKGVDHVLLGLDVFSGEVIDWVFDPSDELVKDLKNEDITNPRDIYREMASRRITPEEKEQAAEPTE